MRMTQKELATGLALLRSEGYFKDPVSDINLKVWGEVFKNISPKHFEQAILERLACYEPSYQGLAGDVLRRAKFIKWDTKSDWLADRKECAELKQLAEGGNE